MKMFGSIPPAFAAAEVEYRRQRIKDSYAAQTRPIRPSRWRRAAARLNWRRRPVTSPAALCAPTLPLGAPYHFVGRS